MIDAGRRAGQRARARPATLVCACLLAVIAVALYGQHVLDGGLYWDDWSNAAKVDEIVHGKDTSSGGTTEPVAQKSEPPPGAPDPTDDHKFNGIIYQPILTLVLIPLPHLVFGIEPAWHLALAVVLGALMSLVFFVLLREAGVRDRHAVAIAVLAFVFPWADSTRLWATAGLNHVAVMFYLGGAILSLRGLRARASPDGAGARKYRAWSLVLYLLSVLTYQISGTAILAGIVLYLAVGFPWRRALRWWGVDIAVTLAAMAFVAVFSVKPTLPLSEQVQHLGNLASGAVTLIADGFAPFGAPIGIVWALAGAVLVLAGLAWRLDWIGGPARAALGRWLLIAGVSIVYVAAAYAIFIPGELKYDPLNTGLYNRVNILAALGIVTFIYAVLALLATLVTAAWARIAPATRPAVVATGLVTAAAIALAVGWSLRVDEDIDQWARAAAYQEQVLDRVRALPPLEDGEAVFTFRHPTKVAHGVPVFAQPWDLDGAVKMVLDNQNVSALPVRPTATLVCGRHTAAPADPGFKEPDPGHYGKLVFVDIPTGRSVRIDNRAQCLATGRLFGRPAVAGDPVREAELAQDRERGRFVKG
jgi:hypothetical protein